LHVNANWRKNMPTLPDRLKALRGLRKQGEFAKFIGVNQAAYSRYETGLRMPDGESLYRMALALKVSVGYLLGKEDSTPGTSPPGTDLPATPTPATSPPATTPATAPPATCRYPADCDLARELADMRAGQLSMAAQLDTLTRLLGARLDLGTERNAKKAG
jgi:hypothetical protein